jgi:hypothetical protein
LKSYDDIYKKRGREIMRLRRSKDLDLLMWEKSRKIMGLSQSKDLDFNSKLAEKR